MQLRAEWGRLYDPFGGLNAAVERLFHPAVLGADGGKPDSAA
jgi:hypothetical protein